MLVNMKEILSHAEKNHYAIACINTPSADNIRAVIGAAEELNAPVIIDHAQVHNCDSHRGYRAADGRLRKSR